MTLADTWTDVPLCALLGVRYPVVQGAFGGFRSQALTAEVSRWGGLGSFGAHGLEPTQIAEVVSELRGLTDRPFAVNLWVSMQDDGAGAVDDAQFARSLAPLLPHIRALGGDPPARTPYVGRRFESQLRALLDAGAPVFSFIFGVPPRDLLDECRRRGVRTIGSATTPDEAVALRQAGVDAVVASGFEAGGHRGSFLEPSERSLIGTFALVPQVVDAVDVPVIAAGGVADGRGVRAALALGAQGVQIGTALLACAGSGATAAHRAALSSGRFVRTALTRGMTGRLARAIDNQLVRELEAPGVEVLPYPLQRGLVRELTARAESAGQHELVTMWCGEAAALSRATDATALLDQLVAEVERRP